MTPFDAFVVDTRRGPHVTVDAGVEIAGRYWMTTSRRSAKAAHVRTVPRASVTLAHQSEIIGGRAVVLDPLHPTTLLAAPLTAAVAPLAIGRLSLAEADQIVGYVEAARSIPFGFLPAGRVIIAIAVDRRIAVERPPELVPSRRSGGRPALPGLPTSVARLLGSPTTAWLGVRTAHGAVAVPAVWHQQALTACVMDSALSACGALLPDRVCVTVDDSRQRRPDRKLGAMLHGTASRMATDGGVAEVRVHVSHITHWEGFDTATIAA